MTMNNLEAYGVTHSPTYVEEKRSHWFMWTTSNKRGHTQTKTRKVLAE